MNTTSLTPSMQRRTKSWSLIFYERPLQREYNRWDKMSNPRHTWYKVLLSDKKVGPFDLRFLLLGIPTGISIWAITAFGMDYLESLWRFVTNAWWIMQGMWCFLMCLCPMFPMQATYQIHLPCLRSADIRAIPYNMLLCRWKISTTNSLCD